MSSFLDNLKTDDWEPFCEVMLRQHFGSKNFYPVPDQDGGDLGLEFFTADGTIFQCYFPEPGIEMSSYKTRVQKKINKDLNKLKENEKEIVKLLGDIKINHWVLLTPENKSKDFLAYCNKKKKEVLKKKISYIDTKNFTVKIETADSYPDGKLYAQGVYNKAIDIPMHEATDQDKNTWKLGNSVFSKNIIRKSNLLMGEYSENFQDRVIAKYIQIEKFLDQLRRDFPDLHDLVEDSARAQLDNIKESALFETEFDKNFVHSIVSNNKEAFAKYSKNMSDKNTQSLSFGYLSKWLAECYMDGVVK